MIKPNVLVIILPFLAACGGGGGATSDAEPLATIQPLLETPFDIKPVVADSPQEVSVAPDPEPVVIIESSPEPEPEPVVAPLQAPDPEPAVLPVEEVEPVVVVPEPEPESAAPPVVVEPVAQLEPVVIPEPEPVIIESTPDVDNNGIPFIDEPLITAGYREFRFDDCVGVNAGPECDEFKMQLFIEIKWHAVESAVGYTVDCQDEDVLSIVLVDGPYLYIYENLYDLGDGQYIYENLYELPLSGDPTLDDGLVDVFLGDLSCTVEAWDAEGNSSGVVPVPAGIWSEQIN